MSAPYDDGPLPDDDDDGVRPCILCFRRDCRGHFPAITASSLTEDQIYDAMARRLIPFTTCWCAFDVPGQRRDKARAEIAWRLEQERKS